MPPVCRPVVDTLPEFGREVSLVYQGLRIVVGIAVILSISDFFHESRGGVSDVHWNRQCAEFSGVSLRFSKGHIDRVTLGCSGQINRCLGQGQAPWDAISE